MKSTVRVADRVLGRASDQLFGFNLAWWGDTPEGISSERLSNPTFLGPAESATGLAPGWAPFSPMVSGVDYRLVAGGNLQGGPAQALHVSRGGPWLGLAQPHRWLREGERLRVTIWARCQDGPADLRVGFRHAGPAGPVYAEAEVQVNSGYYRAYHADLQATIGDPDCVFFCFAQGPCRVWFDRINVRPVEESMHRRDILDLMKDLQVSTLRWPGGKVASNYHWQRGIGPAETRYDGHDASFYGRLCYTWGTDEYLSLCHHLGSRPHLVLNIGTGTPEEATAWAAHCRDWYEARGLELPELVFQLGNEHDSPHEIGHVNADTYISTLRDFVPRVRSAYPRALICSCQGHLEWTRAVASQGQDLLDLLAVHLMPQMLDFQPDREALARLGLARRLGRTLDQYLSMLDDCGLPFRLAISEWGIQRAESYSSQLREVESSARTELYTAACLNEFCRRGQRVALATRFSLLNQMPTILTRGLRSWYTPVAEIYRLWRPLFPAEVCECRVEGPRFLPPAPDNQSAPEADWRARSFTGEDPDAMPFLDALALQRDDGNHLLLSNRHPDQEMEVNLPEHFRQGRAELLSPQVDRRSFHWPPQREMVRGGLLVLPPMSHCRLHASGSRRRRGR